MTAYKPSLFCPLSLFRACLPYNSPAQRTCSLSAHATDHSGAGSSPNPFLGSGTFVDNQKAFVTPLLAELDALQIISLTDTFLRHIPTATTLIHSRKIWYLSRIENEREVQRIIRRSPLIWKPRRSRPPGTAFALNFSNPGLNALTRLTNDWDSGGVEAGSCLHSASGAGFFQGAVKGRWKAPKHVNISRLRDSSRRSDSIREEREDYRSLVECSGHDGGRVGHWGWGPSLLKIKPLSRKPPSHK